MTFLRKCTKWKEITYIHQFQGGYNQFHWLQKKSIKYKNTIPDTRKKTLKTVQTQKENCDKIFVLNSFAQ